MNYNFKDLSGKRFNYWTVLELDEVKNGISKWKCQCDCGKIKSVYGTNLTRGLSKSCGCQSSRLLREANVIDLTGKRYGRLIVCNIHETDGGDVYFDCRCDCGNSKVVRGQDLKRGSVRSCGCLRDDFVPKNKTHGMSKTRLFKIWVGMRQRCENHNNPKYEIYGGRGIKVCSEWQEFEQFMKWSYENGYKDNLTIDRIDSDSNYEPSNCRWVDLKHQANNTRATIFLTYNGETKSASEWSDITGIPQNTITKRKRNGWDDKRNLETPANIYHKGNRKE